MIYLIVGALIGYWLLGPLGACLGVLAGLLIEDAVKHG